MLPYKAYRYVDNLYSSGDEEYGYATIIKVDLEEFDVVKETLKGMWVQPLWAKDYPDTELKHRRFVNLNSRKKFACLSKEDALRSYIARKERQIKILKNQLQNAETALSYAQHMKSSNT